MRVSPILCLALAGAPVAGAAEPAPRFELRVGLWSSEGQVEDAIDSSDVNPLLGSPTSALTYRDMDSDVLELEARVGLPRRWSLVARIGSGGIDGGELIDDDYVSAEGAEFFMMTQSGEHLYSRTSSDIVGDDLRTLGAELQRELLPKDSKSPARLRALVAWREWRETAVANGVEQLVCTSPFDQCAPEGFVLDPPVDVIDNEVRWETVWLGLEFEHPVGSRVRLGARAAYGRGSMRDDDIHLLRDDLAQDPSFRLDGDGDGVELEARVDIHLTRTLALGLGWRSWQLEATDGSIVTYPDEGDPIVTRLDFLESRRSGLLFGLVFAPGTTKPPGNP